MARHIFQSVFKDGQGRIIPSATISVYLAGTVTAANVYTAATGGSPVTSVTTASDGSFSFFVSDSDYSLNQRFKITMTKTDFATKSYDNLTIFAPVPTGVFYPDANATDQGAATTGGYSLKDIIDAAGSNNITIKFRNSSGSATTSYTLTTSEVIPATCAIEIEIGARITQGGTATLTINGPVVGNPMHQWLSGFAAGDVTFGVSSVKYVLPDWFTTNTTPGTTDMNTALQSAINSLTTGKVKLLGSQYLITSVTTKEGIWIEGIGNGELGDGWGVGSTPCSILLYNGATNGKAIIIPDASYYGGFRNFSLFRKSWVNTNTDIGIWCQGTSDGCHNFNFSRLTVGGFKKGISLTRSWITDIYQCQFGEHENGTYKNDIGLELIQCHSTTVYRPRFHRNNIGLQDTDCDGLNVVDVTVEQHTQTAWGTDKIGLDFAGIGVKKISGYFETNGRHIYFGNNARSASVGHYVIGPLTMAGSAGETYFTSDHALILSVGYIKCGSGPTVWDTSLMDDPNSIYGFLQNSGIFKATQLILNDTASNELVGVKDNQSGQFVARFENDNTGTSAHGHKVDIASSSQNAKVLSLITGIGDVLSIRGDGSYVLPVTKTPATASASGIQGEIAWDSSYIYVCTATNTWKRVAIITW